ncbi:MAG: chitobiase/beta-hexosaminidase C-terminal domain-containing protein [Treponemataceae bacterium]|nr:chitobiase/beta-hexosaminidase C-terminal domain-containing protein [Treponemataceae bacterium]
MKYNKILILPLLFILLVFGCKNQLVQTNDDMPSVKYGSLTIGDKTQSRALKIENIKGAKVSVSGNGFSDLSTTTLINDGAITGVTINGIPVGKNRVVTVHAATKDSGLTDAELMRGVIMRAVTDINAGSNSVDVNWSTTALGNVFYELLELKYDISAITAEQKTELQSAIPTGVHATLVDAKAIAEDFLNKDIKYSSAYALKGATITFNVDTTIYDDYIVQVTDPASNKNIKVSAGEVTGITPGTWELVVWYDKFEWYRESQITVTAGDEIDLGSLEFITPKPVIKPESQDFTDSLEISIEAKAGATVYYTIDGTDPSLSSSVYTGPFTITENITVKAFAVIDDLVPSAVVSNVFVKEEPEFIPSAKSGVMLQGFNWSSAKRGAGYYKENPSPYWYKWYKVIENQSEAISTKFAYLWCPPPSATDTASSEGYGPTELNNLNNCYGTEAELKSMIQSIKPTKAIADIVVNHRAGSTCWADFKNPDWGVVKGSNYKVICSDDEGFGNGGDSHMKSVSTSMRGNADISGGGYSAYRDLDHSNTTVQQGIVDWMKNVLKPAGFVGWRYDYVKGFAGKYVGQYNEGSNAEFSVGEYWPTAGYNSGSPDSWGNEIKNWINATDNGGQRSKAFDFALKGAMNTVFGNNASNVGNSNYSLLAHKSNLMISQPEDAVTFIDNHDTGSTQQHWYLDPSDIGTAYAFILTHPGYPCVAWQHYFTYAESGSIVDSYQYIGGNTVPGTDNTYRKHIDYLIELRNRIGIEYDDTVKTDGTSNSCYIGEIIGNNGTLLVKIGNVTAATGEGYAGNDPIYSGTNFAIWEKGVDGEATLGGNGSTGGSSGNVTTGDVTLTVTCPDFTWNDAVGVFCWAWKDGVNGSWYSCTGSGTTIYATVPSDAQYFLIVRCYHGTILPDWEIKSGDILGRIYNKTHDKTIVSGQSSYSIGFVDYPEKQ